MADLLTLFSNNSALPHTPDALHELARRGPRVNQAMGSKNPFARPLAERFSEKQKASLIDRYRAGESASSLAAEFKVATSALINYLRSQAVTVRPTRTVTDEKSKELQREHASGVSMSKLEKRYGLSHSVVFRAIHRAL